MEFPEESVLIARGKYATLSRERKSQIERVQKISTTIMHMANPLLRDCEERPPKDSGPLKMLEDCVKNAHQARGKLIELCTQMNELKQQAWPE